MLRLMPPYNFFCSFALCFLSLNNRIVCFFIFSFFFFLFILLLYFPVALWPGRMTRFSYSFFTCLCCFPFYLLSNISFTLGSCPLPLMIPPSSSTGEYFMWFVVVTDDGTPSLSYSLVPFLPLPYSAFMFIAFTSAFRFCLFCLYPLFLVLRVWNIKHTRYWGNTRKKSYGGVFVLPIQVFHS